MLDIEQSIRNQIQSNPLLVYMKGTASFPQCGFSGRVVEILERCGAQYAYVNILEHPEIRRMLPIIADWPTFPQVYLNGVLIGGCDIVTELFEEGELQTMLEAAGVTGETAQGVAAKV
ncbi:MAG: Grx4 family monothiol glutaredoxin [Pseudomonadota bacterium]